MARPRQPALYELMRGRRGEPAAEPPPRTPSPPGTGPRRPSWFSAGRAVRVPVGYLLLAAAIVIVAAASVFSLGYVRGRGDARRQFEQEWLAVNQQHLPVPPPEIAPRQEAAPQEAEPRSAKPAAKPAPAGPPGWGPVESDPRRAGLNYFVLIHTRRDDAVKVAGFCRDHGVEAYAVPVPDGSLYRVIAAPGFEADDRSSPGVRSLQQRLEEINRLWKLQVNPRDDLVPYPERFRG